MRLAAMLRAPILKSWGRSIQALPKIRRQNMVSPRSSIARLAEPFRTVSHAFSAARAPAASERAMRVLARRRRFRVCSEAAPFTASLVERWSAVSPRPARTAFAIAETALPIVHGSLGRAAICGGLPRFVLAPPRFAPAPVPAPALARDRRAIADVARVPFPVRAIAFSDAPQIRI